MRFVNHKVTRLVVLGIVLGVVLSFGLLQLPWMPVRASTQATRTDQLIDAITYVSGAIFGLVMVVMVYALWKFRRQGPDDMRDGLPIHGHTGLEIFWTAIPVFIVSVFGVYSGIDLSRNESVAHAGTPTRVVLATGARYSWSFTYKTDGGFTSSTLYLPINEGAKIETTSVDVIHGFFVAEWRVKADAVPGLINRTFVTPNRLGTYRVLCSALCGPQHASMSTINVAKVVSDADYAKWVAQQKKAATAAPPGEAVFNGSSGCGGCHTLSKAKSKGTVGPNLDDISADAKAAGQSLPDFVRESIVKPNAYIAKGFPANVMPGTFGSSLSKKDLDALVSYISGDSK
ncbi:MAG TPA: cytochrome c oxidase subunit II transmembrane domain-containing protein [Gaiellales bacterium]